MALLKLGHGMMPAWLMAISQLQRAARRSLGRTHGRRRPSPPAAPRRLTMRLMSSPVRSASRLARSASSGTLLRARTACGARRAQGGVDRRRRGGVRVAARCVGGSCVRSARAGFWVLQRLYAQQVPMRTVRGAGEASSARRAAAAAGRARRVVAARSMAAEARGLFMWRVCFWVVRGGAGRLWAAEGAAAG